MKVSGCAFTTYRGATRTAYLPLADLTVLVGPNDTGKSSILNAIYAASSVTSDEFMPLGVDLWDGPLPGFVWFISPSNSELALIKKLLGERETVDLETGSAEPDRTERAAFDVAQTSTEGLVVALELDRWEEGEEEGETHLAWKTLLCAPAGSNKAASLDLEDRAYLRVPGAPVPIVPLQFAHALPTPQAVFVPLRDPQRLDEQVEQAIEQFLNAIWDTTDADLVANSWHTSEAGGTVQRVRPAVLEACSEFGASATQFLPRFVRDRYDIRIRVDPIGHWGQLGKLDVELYDRREDAGFPVANAAEGYWLWIQLAVLETALRATQKALVVRTLEEFRDFTSRYTREGFDVEALDAPLQMLEAIEGAPLGAGTGIPRDAHAIMEPLRHFLNEFSTEGPDALARPLLYLIDEPEQHLNPALQRSAARWLHDLVETGTSQIVMATHAHTFLDLRGGVSYVATHRGHRHTVLQSFDPAQLEALDIFATEMGFDRGELIARVRVLLFVEGPADRVVIEALFPDELRSSGTQIIELRSITFAHTVVDDVLVTLTGTRVAILLDKITTDKAQEMAKDHERRDELAGESDEAKQLGRLLRAADQAGRAIHPFGLGLPDILDALDDAALRALAPAWPGHDSARQAWEAYQDGKTARSRPKAKGSRLNRKKFYEQRYGLDSKVESIRRAAEHMAEREAKPAVLAEMIFELERLSLN